MNPQTGRSYNKGIVAEVTEVKIESSGKDTTGQVTGGHLRLRGPLCTAHFHHRKDFGFAVKVSQEIVTCWARLRIWGAQRMNISLNLVGFSHRSFGDSEAESATDLMAT